MVAGLLLAAGGARRFGSQKLVAMLGDTPIVRRSALLLSPHVDELVVVVGNEAERVRRALDGLTVRVVENPGWSEGQASSLRTAFAALSRTVEGAIVVLGDQPGIDPSVFTALKERWRSAATAIVAPRYRGTISPPILFARTIFAEIAALRGDVGARAVVERDPARVSFIDLDAPPPVDVDTVADLRSL